MLRTAVSSSSQWYDPVDFNDFIFCRLEVFKCLLTASGLPEMTSHLNPLAKAAAPPGEAGFLQKNIKQFPQLCPGHFLFKHLKNTGERPPVCRSRENSSSQSPTQPPLPKSFATHFPSQAIFADLLVGT